MQNCYAFVPYTSLIVGRSLSLLVETFFLSCFSSGFFSDIFIARLLTACVVIIRTRPRLLCRLCMCAKDCAVFFIFIVRFSLLCVIVLSFMYDTARVEGKKMTRSYVSFYFHSCTVFACNPLVILQLVPNLHYFSWFDCIDFSFLYVYNVHPLLPRALCRAGSIPEINK